MAAERALPHLAQRPHDSGQFRGLLDEEMLGAGLYQRTNWPTATAKFPSLVNRIKFPHGGPGAYREVKLMT